MVRTPHKPLQQISRRLLEKHKSEPHKHKKQTCALAPLISSLHFNGPTLNFQGMQYKEIESHDFHQKIELADNCLMLKNNSIILAQNFIFENNQLFIIGQEFLHKTAFYNKPWDSSIFGIYLVSQLSPLNYWSGDEFLYKGVLLPYETENVFFPLLHCFDNF